MLISQRAGLPLQVDHAAVGHQTKRGQNYAKFQVISPWFSGSSIIVAFKSMKPNVSVIIPVLNEEESIAAVLGDIPPELGAEVLVVDNGCTDRTIAIAHSLGAQIVVAGQQGYGAACYAGHPRRDRRHSGLSGWGLFRLSGGDDRPDCPHRRGAGGSGVRLAPGPGRSAPQAMPPQQRLGNWLTARLMRGLYGLPVTDLSPFRAIRKETVLALNMREMTFGWPTEMMVKAARAGYRLEEIPVGTGRGWGAKARSAARCAAPSWRGIIF